MAGSVFAWTLKILSRSMRFGGGAWNDETLKLNSASKAAREAAAPPAALKDVDGAKLQLQLQQVLQRGPFAALGELSQRLFGTFGSPERPPTQTPKMESVAEEEEEEALALAAMTYHKGTCEPAREFLAWLRAHNLELDEILSDDCGVHARVVPRGGTTHHPANDARNEAYTTFGDYKLPRNHKLPRPAASISSPTTALAPHRLTFPRLPSPESSTSCSISSPPAAGEPNTLVTTLHPGTPSPPPSQRSAQRPNGPRKGASAHTDAGRSPQASRRANGSERPRRMQVPSPASNGSEPMRPLDFETLSAALALDSCRNPNSLSRERLPSIQLSSTPMERELLGQLLGASRLTPAAHYVEAAAAIRGTVDDERARLSAVRSQLDFRTHSTPRLAHSALSSPQCSLLPTVLSPPPRASSARALPLPAVSCARAPPPGGRATDRRLLDCALRRAGRRGARHPRAPAQAEGSHPALGQEGQGRGDQSRVSSRPPPLMTSDDL